MKYLVAGNYAKFSVTLTQKSGELITPYIPTEGDVVQISLYGARRFDYPNYTQASNVLTFEDNGCLQVGLYCLEVKITEANTHKLRCMYREQIRVVASNDDVPTDASFTDDDVQLSGQFDIVASTEIVVDDELSLTSTNPVQNKVVTAALNTKGDALTGGLAALGYEIELKRGNTPLSFLCIPVADAQTDGLMLSSDYSKLADLPTNADLTTALNGKQATLTFDSTPTQNSTNPVTSGGLFDVIKRKADGIEASPYNLGVELYLKSGNNVIYSGAIRNATTDTGGIMSAADKTKLDGIEAQANRIDGISADAASGGYVVYLKNGNTTVASVGIPWAWNSQDGGLMARTDYDRLHNLVGDSLGADYTAGGLDIELKCGNTTLSYVSVPFATAQDDGLMSASDYSKLAALPTNAALTTALAGKEDKVVIEAPVNTTDATLPITALNTDTGKYYRIDVAVETLAITLPAMTDSTKIANVVLMLTGGTTPAVTIASTAPSGGTAPDVYYQDGFAIEAGKTYEVNCLYNGVAWVVAAVEITVS